MGIRVVLVIKIYLFRHPTCLCFVSFFHRCENSHQWGKCPLMVKIGACGEIGHEGSFIHKMTRHPPCLFCNFFSWMEKIPTSGTTAHLQQWGNHYWRPGAFQAYKAIYLDTPHAYVLQIFDKWEKFPPVHFSPPSNFFKRILGPILSQIYH